MILSPPSPFPVFRCSWTALYTLVDELYWECHENITSLDEPASLLAQLRHVGVRAHSWA
jgi:hypothetical protein